MILLELFAWPLLVALAYGLQVRAMTRPYMPKSVPQVQSADTHRIEVTPQVTLSAPSESLNPQLGSSFVIPQWISQNMLRLQRETLDAGLDREWEQWGERLAAATPVREQWIIDLQKQGKKAEAARIAQLRESEHERSVEQAREFAKLRANGFKR